MAVLVTIPTDFDREPLADRLRWAANQHMRASRPNLRMVEMLREAATEVELGQRTPLTFRGHDTA